jgi:hypothetical protein
MEIHRLKPMKEGYDQKLFNKLYKETESLRKTLTYQINPRRFGVTSDIVLSWFDDKFIWVFNKYADLITPDQLKGRMINSLSTFKFRILRKAYSKQNVYANEINILRLDDYDSSIANIIPDKLEIDNRDLFLELALKYLKNNLCDDALLVLEIELNPPPYIMVKMDNPKTKIPAKLIAEYLDLESNKDSINFINDLRKEIKLKVDKARDHFVNREFATQLL